MHLIITRIYFISHGKKSGTGYGKFTCMYRVMDLLTNEQENSSNASNACMHACRAKTNKMGYEEREFGPTYCSFIFVHAYLIIIVQNLIYL